MDEIELYACANTLARVRIPREAYASAMPVAVHKADFCMRAHTHAHTHVRARSRPYTHTRTLAYPNKHTIVCMCTTFVRSTRGNNVSLSVCLSLCVSLRLDAVILEIHEPPVTVSKRGKNKHNQTRWSSTGSSETCNGNPFSISGISPLDKACMTPNVLSPPNSTVREGAGTSARAGPGDAASGSDNCTTNGSDVFYSPCGATSNGTNESFTGVTSVNGNALQVSLQPSFGCVAVCSFVPFPFYFSPISAGLK